MQINRLILATLGLSAALLMNEAFAADEPAKDTAKTSQKDTAKPPPAAPLPDPVALVNGQPISKDMYEVYAQQRQRQQPGGNPNNPQFRQALTNELVLQELLVQEAKKQKLDQDPGFRFQMEIAQRGLLAAAMVNKVLGEKPPTEEAIQQEYESFVATMSSEASKQEYKARHILVDSEDKAKTIIQEIKEGGDFSELAKTHSSDSSKDKGGDLGWFAPNIMVPPFAEAVTKLEKGKFTEEPVKSQFGWHVVMLDDVRDATPPAPPSLEEVRPQLAQRLRSRTMREYMDGLRQDATIELK